MHTLVQLQHLARKEFTRNIGGLSEEDARKRVEPMNCISWIIGHVALQQHTLFVAWPHAMETGPQFDAFHTGSPPSQPPLADVMALWHASCAEAGVWFDAATEESLQGPFTSPEGENGGTLVVRGIFHAWCHLGEISSIWQMLGHRPPEFVDLYGWSYPGE